MQSTNTNIRKSVLIPFILAIVTLVIAGISGMYWLLSSEMDNATHKKSHDIEHLYQSAIDNDASLLHSLITQIQQNNYIQDTWLKNDRHALLLAVQKDFEFYHSHHRITHFYFHDLQGRVFLRMHNPDKYGDTIHRYTFQQSKTSGQPFHGLEFGMFGHFVLRAVHPWYQNGDLIGYVELGVDVEYLTVALAKSLDLELFVLIRKSLLDLEQWLKSQDDDTHTQANWDNYSDYVVTQMTKNAVPKLLDRQIRLEQPLHDDHSHSLDLVHEGNYFHTFNMPLEDVQGKNVGSVIFMMDTTSSEQRLGRSIIFLILIGFVVITALTALFYRYLGGIEKTLANSQIQLEEEIRLHRKTERVLRSRSDLLEASNKELESYSYSIAHDLRTPLRSVTSFSQILQEEANAKLSDEENDSLLRIVSAGKHMSELIDDILELARISRRQMNISNVNLSELAKSAAEQLCMSNSTHEVNWHIEENLKTKGDQILLSLVMQNLLGNACKYTRDKPSAEINFGSTSTNGRVTYYVRDNGIGFNMDYVGKIFNPFQRLHKSQDYEGTGVGLATVQRIIERHGGKIWAEGKVNKGAVFYFELGQHHVKTEPETQRTSIDASVA